MKKAFIVVLVPKEDDIQAFDIPKSQIFDNWDMAWDCASNWHLHLTDELTEIEEPEKPKAISLDAITHWVQIWEASIPENTEAQPYFS